MSPFLSHRVGVSGGGAGRLGRLAPGLASPPSRNRSAPQSRHAGPHLQAEYVADACLAPHLRGQVPQCHTCPGIRVNVVLRMEAGRKEVWVQWTHQTVSPQSPGSSAWSLEFVAATASHPPMLFLGGGGCILHHGGLRWQERILLAPQAGLDSDSLFISTSRRPSGYERTDLSPTASGASGYENTRPPCELCPEVPCGGSRP